jgi:hypothetical protein
MMPSISNLGTTDLVVRSCLCLPVPPYMFYSLSRTIAFGKIVLFYFAYDTLLYHAVAHGITHASRLKLGAGKIAAFLHGQECADRKTDGGEWQHPIPTTRQSHNTFCCTKTTIVNQTDT